MGTDAFVRPGFDLAPEIQKLREKFDAKSSWEGHEFTRAVRSFKMIRASAPKGRFGSLDDFFRTYFQLSLTLPPH